MTAAQLHPLQGHGHGHNNGHGPNYSHHGHAHAHGHGHGHFNYNRRNLSALPYPMPIKQNSPNNYTHHRRHSHGHYDQTEDEFRVLSSVPTLSREFVVRRISEGETGRLKEELKCEACGKGYKHISSLAKHLWEHTPEWNVTKKLLISKHQQVQLLEAASILVGMNEPPFSSRRNSVFHDDEDSAISSAIGSDISSAPVSKTPTPPMKTHTRSNSLSLPDTDHDKETGVLDGGYLDTKSRALRTSRTGSISFNSKDDLVLGEME